MLLLPNIQPPGKLESTVRGLMMHFIQFPVQDVTASIQLGGAFSTVLRGPTPLGLVNPVAAALAVPPVIPPLPFFVPLHTRPSAAAMNPANWRM
jgi:hypothetical protein